MGPFVWNSNQNIPQLPPYSLYIKSSFSTTNYDSFGFDVRLWAKELLDYLHVPTWDASCQGPFAPCAWVGLPSCGTTPLDIYNIGGGGVQIRTENCTWLFSDGCELYLPGGIVFPDGSSLMSTADLGKLSITDGTTTVTGVTAINFAGASVSGTSPNGIVTITPGLTGSGTSNYIPYFNSSTSITSSLLYFNGSQVGLNTTSFLTVGAKDNAATASGTTSNPSFTISNVSGVVAYSAQINDGSLDKRVAYFINGVDSLWGHSFTQSSGAAYTYGIWMSTSRVLSLRSNGNMILRSSTTTSDFNDTGYKLDVFGTLRVASGVTFTGIASAATSTLVYYNPSTGIVSYGATMPSGYTLGDTLYGNASGTVSALPGNTATSKKFLTQTGTGTVSAAPAWFDLFNTANTFNATQTISVASGLIFSFTALYGSPATHIVSRINTNTGDGAMWLATDISANLYSAVAQQATGSGGGSGYINLLIRSHGSALTPYFTAYGDQSLVASHVNMIVGASTSGSSYAPIETTNSTLDVLGSFAAQITLVSGNTTLTDKHFTILCSAATGAINITLPTIAGRGRRIYTIKRLDNTSNAITLIPSSSEYVEGGNTSYALPTTQYSSITIQAYSPNNNWYIIGKV